MLTHSVDRLHHVSTFEDHKTTLDSLHGEASSTYGTAQERLRKAKDDIKAVSNTVLGAVSTACKISYFC
jgi:hypothetical protein